MKYVILGDTHFIPKDSEIFVQYIERFFTDILFPYIETNKITTIIQVGDLFDTRKHTNHFSLYHTKRIFFDKLRDKKIQLICILGNHDLYLKEFVNINTPRLVLGEYDNITIVDTPTSIYGMTFLPWICNENYDSIMSYIESDTNKICFAHLELANFSMYKGFESKIGMSATVFEKYSSVITGHYHTRSSKGNITYVGTPYEMCWHDSNDVRGFHVLDRKLKFIPNPLTLFDKIIYNDTDYRNIDLKLYENKYIKVIVEKKSDTNQYEVFLNALNNIHTHNLIIIDKEKDNEELQSDIDDCDDTVSILNTYIDNTIEDTLDSSKIKTIMFDIYNTALRDSNND